MNKKEIAEIKKQYTPEKCPASWICGCYVDGEKKKQTEFSQSFLTLPEEELFKYLNIFRKLMSGTLGKNMLTMEFPLETELEGGTHELLMQLKYTGLKDDSVLEDFYDKIIDSYYYVGNYLILLLYGNYDIPGKSSDNQEMFDASDEVYEHIFCCICPVNLSKPGLSYSASENCFHNRIQDWVVEMPLVGFLFPAFQDRSTDLHSLLYYNQKPEEPASDFVDSVLGCVLPRTAGGQKETFQELLEKTLREDCSYDALRAIYDNLTEMIEDQKDEPEPLQLQKADIKRLLEESDVPNEKLEAFDEQYEEIAGEESSFVASNVVNSRRFEIKTPDVVVQVSPEKTHLVETREIEGKRCLVISLEDEVEVNGVPVK